MTILYPLEGEFRFGCNELEDVSFHVHNCFTSKEAADKLEEALVFIRSRDARVALNCRPRTRPSPPADL